MIMEINILLEYFDKLNDENAMFIEFKNGGQLLVDNNDIIRANGSILEIKSTTGIYITEVKYVVGLKIANRVDIMRKAMIGELITEIGE